MKRVLALSVLIAAAVPALAYDYPKGLSADGIGTVKVGLNIDRVEAILRDKLGYNQFNNRGCSVLTTKQLENSGLSFMIESNILTRVNLDYVGKSEIPATIKTDTGLGLGASEEDVKKAYPGARVKANPADPTWHTIFADTPDRLRAIVFETDGVKVKSIRAGAYPAVATSNGCN
jgi:hypothetical protein